MRGAIERIGIVGKHLEGLNIFFFATQFHQRGGAAATIRTTGIKVQYIRNR